MRVRTALVWTIGLVSMPVLVAAQEGPGAGDDPEPPDDHMGSSQVKGELVVPDGTDYDLYHQRVQGVSDPDYAPYVWLSIGDYYFEEENNPLRALEFYRKAEQFPDSGILYGYALYKKAWCHYNLDRKERAMEVFVDLLDYTATRPDRSNIQMLADQTRRDLVPTYADFGTPDKAFPFFESLIDDYAEVVELVERLGGMYAERGKYKYSSTIYRMLIRERQESHEVVDYQYAIVGNHLIRNPYSRKTVEEFIKLMALVQVADDGRLDGTDGSDYRSERDRVEQLVYKWASRYHHEAQTTGDPSLFKMANFLCDHFLETFPESEHAAEVASYNADE